MKLIFLGSGEILHHNNYIVIIVFSAKSKAKRKDSNCEHGSTLTGQMEAVETSYEHNKKTYYLLIQLI